MNSSLKFHVLILFAAIVCTVNAQNIRIETGYTIPVQMGKEVSSTYFNGIKIGATVEFELKNNFSLLSGALYNTVYSNKLQIYPNSTSARYLTTSYSIDVPIHLTYSLPLSKTLKLFGYVGPSLNIGLHQGKGIISTVSTISSGYTELYQADKMYRLNYQVGAGGGIQWRKFQIKSGYDFGINNLNKTDSGKFTQRGWHVSFGYQF